MKTSTKGLLVLFAIVMSFGIAQSGWATTTTAIEGPYYVNGTVSAYQEGNGITILYATVTDVDANTMCGVDQFGRLMSCDENESPPDDWRVAVSGMGPAGYWAKEEVVYPQPPGSVTIVVYQVEQDTNEDGTADTIRLVAAAVDVNDDGEDDIVLRVYLVNPDGDDQYLLPEWTEGVMSSSGTKEEVEFSATAPDSAGDCCPGCDECEPHEYLEPGPHGNNSQL